jgi:hypothetical protein
MWAVTHAAALSLLTSWMSSEVMLIVMLFYDIDEPFVLNQAGAPAGSYPAGGSSTNPFL